MTKRVLYVEDHFNNMLLIKRIVGAEGHEFLTAAEGQSGLDMALAHRPDLIFVDLRLPGTMPGQELIRRLKASPTLRDVPVVVLTAYGHGEAMAAAQATGCDGILHKPADIQQIQAVIRHYVGAPERSRLTRSGRVIPAKYISAS
ncbi:MAG: response regulator [Chloroflexota bacterium]|nr:MAG: response regulator [Chloroflexota bacterium]